MQRVPFLLFTLFLPSVLVAQTTLDSKGAKPNSADASAATRSGITVTAEQWARPRSGDAVAGIPQLARLVASLDQDASSQLVLHFASGDEGTLWAEELRSWLVALGVASTHITLAPGHPQTDTLLIEVRRSTAR